MIIKPKVRGFICITSHPEGCEKHVQQQIDYVKAKGVLSDMPKRVLVIGASTGYGLASRIVPAFAGGAATIGVFFERPSESEKPASAGWYNSVSFEKAAHAAGLYAKSINGDAFSDDIKTQTIEMIESRSRPGRSRCLQPCFAAPDSSKDGCYYEVSPETRWRNFYCQNGGYGSRSGFGHFD